MGGGKAEAIVAIDLGMSADWTSLVAVDVDVDD
jgi:hypothetical protein